MDEANWRAILQEWHQEIIKMSGGNCEQSFNDTKCMGCDVIDQIITQSKSLVRPAK